MSNTIIVIKEKKLLIACSKGVYYTFTVSSGEVYFEACTNKKDIYSSRYRRYTNQHHDSRDDDCMMQMMCLGEVIEHVLKHKGAEKGCASHKGGKGGLIAILVANYLLWRGTTTTTQSLYALMNDEFAINDSHLSRSVPLKMPLFLFRITISQSIRTTSPK